jgi:eukaryotic-like serine/threonine-protein kinase
VETIQGYYLKTKLGAGGMASVYLGTQKSLDRPVAIKILNASLIDDAFIQAQFTQESKLIASLNHPNIVQVIDKGISEQGHPYFVMPYVKSISLNALLKRDDISEARKIDIIIQVCKALAYAHRNGVIHRDIKPGNILVDYDGHVRLVDFGIAGYFSPQKNSKPEKNTPAKKYAAAEIVMGTDAYMAPEQFNGAHKASHLSDIYSLGVVMHQLFFGELPYQINTSTYSKGNGEHSGELRQLINCCTHPSPEERPASVDNIRQELLLIIQGKHLRTNRWNSEARQDNIPTNYKLLDVLKENPFGATYLVNDPKRERLLVIKKQLLDQIGNAQMCATKLLHIQHPHIARIFGNGKNNRVMITATEYCHAGSLQERLTQAYSLGQWLQMAQQICGALSYAHSQGIIHGNLRPSNILFAENNHVKVGDFGFPPHAYDDESLWYHPSKEPASASADIYAAGAILFQLLTGKIPSPKFWGLKNHWALRSTPKPLRNIILHMVRRNNRIASAALAAQAFEHLQGEQKTHILQKIMRTH